MDKTLEDYIEFIKRDLESLRDARFTGNIEFKVNFKDGGIANMNCSKNKSVKLK